VISGFPGVVLERMLEGDHPVLEILRVQADQARVRAEESSEFGTLIDLWVEEDAPTLDVEHRFAIDDLFGQVRGFAGEVGFQLHVVRGRLKTIEAWVSEPGFPPDPELETSWYVAPDPDPEAAEVVRAAHRNLEFALRGIDVTED
jgi:hypothetical protein